jgi:hypothetical protein
VKKLVFSLLGVGFLSLSSGCDTRALAREVSPGFPASSAQPLSSPAADDDLEVDRPVDHEAHMHAGHDHQGEVYTCPMHPEVVSHEPGQCPKCGMHLEKKK